MPSWSKENGARQSAIVVRILDPQSAVAAKRHRVAPMPGTGFSAYRNATVCRPAISKRLRQRMFLQAIRSSLRSM